MAVQNAPKRAENLTFAKVWQELQACRRQLEEKEAENKILKKERGSSFVNDSASAELRDAIGDYYALIKEAETIAEEGSTPISLPPIPSPINPNPPPPPSPGIFPPRQLTNTMSTGTSGLLTLFWARLQSLEQSVEALGRPSRYMSNPIDQSDQVESADSPTCVPNHPHSTT
eukprot:gnl/MRDRNA2_/MRDRNA2_351597_c0_seq1.p1 gnl/MRDRNA2_/MRDRNA2_351597_c0~~gnl/MRDRNA2_/MRDRNA2_351597_c0_seq1.p1  ORF type:complete len:198 (-),score=29.51 gnl/MRDRNA2_/MRDRNA2_351597_c0_seq1:131-646(-)